MSVKESLHTHYSQLKAMILQSQLLLIHPNNKFANLLVAQLVHDPDLNKIFYSLNNQNQKLPGFVTNLANEIAEQSQEAHVKNLSRTLIQHVQGTNPSNLETLVNRVISILEHANREAYILILENFDLVDTNHEIQSFIEALALALPSQIQLVISARHMPHLAWSELIATGTAQIFHSDETIHNTKKTPSQSKYAAYAFNEGIVTIDGEKVTNWEGYLPRILFFFVLNRGRATRNEICKALWPNLELLPAVNVFHVTKRRLHKAIGFDILVHQNEEYRIDPSISIYYDVEAFIETLTAARNNPDNLPLWRKANDLYQNDFLHGFEKEAWINNSREAFTWASTEIQKALKSFRKA